MAGVAGLDTHAGGGGGPDDAAGFGRADAGSCAQRHENDEWPRAVDEEAPLKSGNGMIGALAERTKQGPYETKEFKLFLVGSNLLAKWRRFIPFHHGF